MEESLVIRFEHVSKKYRRKKDYFYALKDVSFEIYKGQTVGVLGTNGSGKSTLSLLVAGMMMPDEGKVDVNGNAELVTIQTGLNKQLTGMENIWLKASMLGFSKKEIAQMAEQIVCFAELGEYIREPVKKYSTGMISRLGFSINLFLHAEVLIIDEALSVGDKAFAHKCMQQIQKLKKQGKTILFVSHSLAQVREICDVCIWIEGGKLREYGRTEQVSAAYEQFVKEYREQTQKKKQEILDRQFRERLSKRERRRVFIKMAVFVLEMLYRCFWLFPVQDKITFLSRQSDAVSLDYQLLIEELEKIDQKGRRVVLCKTLTFPHLFSYAFHMLIQMYHIATSKVVVLDSYCIPVSLFRHRKALKVIQIWHSVGTMKKFGYAILDREEGASSELAHLMKMHANYNYVLASSECYKSDLAQAFRCRMDQIKVIPLPRIERLVDDAFSKKIQEKIYRRYPEYKGKKIILYCPTFRKNEKCLRKHICALKEVVKDEQYILVMKLHPLSKCDEDVWEFQSFDWLFVADYVISDYSCIVYEAAVRKIPVYFYAFDREEYEQARGLFLEDYGKLPGFQSDDPFLIWKEIESGDYNRKALEEFSDQYVVRKTGVIRELAEFIMKVKN